MVVMVELVWRVKENNNPFIGMKFIAWLVNYVYAHVSKGVAYLVKFDQY